MTLPNFFIIGAPKSGTTALYYSLAQHPQIFMPARKEPYFFAFDGSPPISPGPAGSYYHHAAVWQPDEYKELFSAATDQKAIGEGSTLYMRSTLAAQRISRDLPSSKIIAILRQPADRAFSSYWFTIQNGVEPASTFAAALAHERAGLRKDWFIGLQHMANSFYYAQLSTYYQLFPREQIRVYLYDDLRRAPRTLLRDLFNFLAIDEEFEPTLEQKNVTLTPKNRLLNNFVQQKGVRRLLPSRLPLRLRRSVEYRSYALNRKFNLVVPPPHLDPELRRTLTAEYRDDTNKLQELIRHDLDHWHAD